MLKSKIQGLLRQYRIRPYKGWGQNFLISDSAAAAVLKAAGLNKDDLVLEIGPGLGSLTQFLVEKASLVVAVEKDRKLCAIIEEQFKDCYNLRLIPADFLGISISDICSRENTAEVKIIGNIPYYITTPIILKILEEKRFVSGGVLTIEEAVAARLAAAPATPDYGRLSCLAQYHLDLALLDKICAAEFYPAPKVDSRIVKFSVRKEPLVRPKDETLFFRIIKAGFSQRRKMLVNNLSQSFSHISKANWQQVLKQAGIAPQARAEVLGLREFASLADAVVGFDLSRVQ